MGPWLAAEQANTLWQTPPQDTLESNGEGISEELRSHFVVLAGVLNDDFRTGFNSGNGIRRNRLKRMKRIQMQNRFDGLDLETQRVERGIARQRVTIEAAVRVRTSGSRGGELSGGDR
jgi:hypothetical protein